MTETNHQRQTPAPRAVVSSIELPMHGGLDHAELESLGLRPDDVVDFSANLNPWGASSSAQEAIAAVSISRYPDAEASMLRRALAERLDVPAGRVIAGNGSSELIWLISLAFLDPGDRVLVAAPTFGEYERAARLAGASVVFEWASPADGYRHDVRLICHAAARVRPKIVFLCNPNNPTGAYLAEADVRLLAECLPDGLLVLDEAYIGLIAQPWSALVLPYRNIVILRSMTKDFGLAGLRLGFAVADGSVINALRKVRPPWNVNAAAQAAGIASVGAAAEVATAAHLLRKAKTYLEEALIARGFPVIPSETTFFLVEVGAAADFRKRLLARGLLVRDCASFGLPNHIRIAARTQAECERLIAAIDAIGGKGQ